MAALQTEDQELRGQVAWALGEIGNSTALQTLTALAANDPSADVRLQATQALAHLPEQPRVTVASTSPETELTVAQPSPMVVDQAREVRTPEWLSANLPSLALGDPGACPVSGSLAALVPIATRELTSPPQLNSCSVETEGFEA